MFLIIAFLLIYTGSLAKEENDLQLLIDKNYKQFLDKNQISMLFFYTPQCGHCERFQPEVEKAAKQLKEDGFEFGKVDGHNYKDIAKQFEVNGFPSVILSLDHGKKYKKFEGPRTSESIIMWMFEQLNPGSQELKTLTEIREKITTSQLMYLFMAENDQDRGFRRYKDYSHVYGDLQFYHTFIENIQSELGLGPTDALVAYKKYDKQTVVYQPKQIKVSDLKAFIETNMYQRLQEYNEDISKKIFKQDRQALILLFDETQMKDKNAKDALKSIAIDHPHEDHLLFIQCSVTNPLFEQLQKHIGDYSGTPSLIGLQKYGVYKYKFNSAFTKNNLDQFIVDFKNGKATKHYKSEKLDNPIYSQNVENLNGNIYQKIINGSEDWVILYYNSFDPDHIQLLQQFADIGKQIGKISKVKFGIVDVAKNELSDFSDPTDIVKIRLYKGAKTYARFTLKVNKIQNERLITFIKENSNYEFHDDRKSNHYDDL